MKKIMQFRYGGDSNIDNYPNAGTNKITANRLVGANIFEPYEGITSMGIQGQPGTAFYLNGQEYQIVLGETGIYEIDLQDRGSIKSIKFVNNPTFMSYNSTNRLLIDIIYIE